MKSKNSTTISLVYQFPFGFYYVVCLIFNHKNVKQKTKQKIEKEDKKYISFSNCILHDQRIR